MVCLAIKIFFCYGGGGEWGGGEINNCSCVCGMHASLYTLLSEPFLLGRKINNPSCVLWDAHCIVYHVVGAFSSGGKD